MSVGVANIKGREVCSSQEMAQNQHSDPLPNCYIILTLPNSRISERNLSNDLLFMVLQKPTRPTTHCNEYLHTELSGMSLMLQ